MATNDIDYDEIYAYDVMGIGLLCGLDGEYLPPGHDGDVPGSVTEVWGAVCEAFTGGAYGWS